MCQEFRAGVDYGAGELSAEEASLLNFLTRGVLGRVLSGLGLAFWNFVIGGVIAWIVW
jgi:hypothetical protein